MKLLENIFNIKQAAKYLKRLFVTRFELNDSPDYLNILSKLFPSISIILYFTMFLLLSCNTLTTQFKKVSPDESGIHFSNIVIENDSINPLDLEFLYNGGGVGIGDFNRDVLADLYFAASMNSNKLYLNKGKFSFEDITDEDWCFINK